PEPERSSTLATLLQRLRQNEEFPALSRHIADVSQRLANPDQTSAGELAGAILKDYALTTRLLRLVNSSFYGQYGGRISTVSRAVVILGFSQVRAAALALLLFENLEGHGQVEALRESAGRAFFAGALGRRLADELGVSEPEQGFVCSMFRTLGRYLTVFYLPEDYAAVRATAQSRGIDEGAAAVSVLGASFEALGRAVAREWHLPAEILDAMRALPPGPVAAAGDPRDRLHQLAVLSNDLTEALTDPNPDSRARALAALEERFARALPIGETGLRQAVESALSDVRAYARSTGFDLFRGSADTAAITDWLSAARGKTSAGSAARTEGTPASPAAPGSESTEVDGPYATLLAGLQDITQALLEEFDLNDILVMVLETAYRGLALARVVLFIREPRSGCLSARFGLGAGVETLLPRLRFCPSGSDDPFSRAVREARDLVHHDTSAAGRATLPAWYRETCGGAAFALLPLVVHRVCLGLVYAEREPGARPLTATEMGHLHTLRNQAALAFRHRG
ncbi:MAG: HDOD domain-containing protein, partial [Gammaproteobacteria bacterium]|nr:HDOD domain-containing protein [Gammaproteobacteria bacterium]